MPVINTCPGLRGDAVNPRADRRIRVEGEAALVGAVRVRVERDVRDGHRVAGEPVASLEAELERGERLDAALRQVLALRLPDLRLRRVRLEEARDRDRRLVVVLLEEHPLQRFRAVVAVLGDEARALAEVPDDRVRLRERPAVVEDERRRIARRVEPGELVARIAAIDHVDLPQLERDPEMRGEEPHLVTVARDRAVVEDHRPLTYAALTASASSRGSRRETICETPSPPIVTP